MIDHDRRKILHFNVTARPIADWVVQQLREALPGPTRHRYVILDRDTEFSREVLDFLGSSGIKAVRTSVRSQTAPDLIMAKDRYVGTKQDLVHAPNYGIKSRVIV